MRTSWQAFLLNSSKCQVRGHGGWGGWLKGGGQWRWEWGFGLKKLYKSKVNNNYNDM